MSLKRPNTPAEYFIYSLIKSYDDNDKQLQISNILSSITSMLFAQYLSWNESFEKAEWKALMFAKLLENWIKQSKDIVEKMKEQWKLDK